MQTILYCIFSINPKKQGMQADSKYGICWIFKFNYCWLFKSNTPMPRCWYCNVSENNSTKRVATLYIQLDFYIQLVAGGGGDTLKPSPSPHHSPLPLPSSKFFFFLNNTEPSAGHWNFKSPPAAGFFLSPFSQWKQSYFEVLIKLKKNGHAVCDQ